MNTEEVWKRSTVPGTRHLFVSNMGRVKFPEFADVRGYRQKERITSGSRDYDKDTNSYYLKIETLGKPHLVHRLVAFAFHGDSWRPWLIDVDHITVTR